MPKPARAKPTPSSDKTEEVLCFAAAQVDASATEPPNELLVCPWGTTETRRGKVTVDGHTLAVFAAEQQKRRWDRLALDFSHNTVCQHEVGSAAYDAWLAQEPREVAAFASAECRENVGIIYKDLRWTDAGKAKWKSYEDLSPAVVRNASGQVTALHSTALCRTGEMDGVTLFSSLDPSTNYTGTFLTPDKTMLLELLSKMLTKAGVTVPADATEESIAALASDYCDAAEETKEEETPAAPDVAALSATVTELAEKLTLLSAELTSIKDGTGAPTTAQRRADLVAEATRQGKVIPLSAAEIEQLPIEVFSSLVANLGVTVPTDHKVGTAAQETVTTFSAEDITVMKQLGISEDRFKAFKAAQAAK